MDISALYARFLENRTVCTDTRNIIPGSIFFALKGDRFDGNTFARKALADGAAAAVVSDPTLTGKDFILVEDTLAALQALARYHRRQLGLPVIAITGSNGKTTTKELVTTALSTTFRVHATRGNLNNHIGVPLTLLSVPDGTELIICEMGANHVGEIAMLSAIAEPTHGLITNIGQAHLEGFGGIEGVKRGKGELFDHLRTHQGMAFVNAGDPALADLAGRLTNKVLYGLWPEGQDGVCFRLDERPDGTGFTLHDVHGPTIIEASIYGAYNAINMVAAIAVGRHFGVPEPILATAMAQFTSGANRSEVVHMHGCTIVKDAYNANPSSMDAAIRAFAHRHPDGWIIAGDMKELGSASGAAHMHILALLLNLPVERIVLVGPEFMAAAEAARSIDHRLSVVPSVEALAAHWRWPTGRSILLKGSRSMQLERILDA